MRNVLAIVLFLLAAASATTAWVPAESPMSVTRLPTIEDDYSKARAEASQRKLPLFVDVWAPW